MKITNGPGDAETLVDILRLRAESQPDRLAYAFLPDGEEAEERLTYAELHARASSLAAHLQDLGAQGGRALLLYPTGLDYVTAFFGCLCAGTVAVPAYPPRPNRPMPRIHAIVADAGATVALTTSRILSGLERRIADLPDLKALAWRATDLGGDAAVPASAWRAPGIRRADLAFLQYTSGSTASPKGVIVSHGNLMHNEELIRRACGHSGETPFVSWLPLYHDLGLIGNLLQALYVGAPCTLMTPVSFLKSPIRWLDAVSRRRAYCSGGPNFAYDLTVRKTTPEQRQGLDLSGWRVAFNGAEPVRAETLERFARTFAPYGFRSSALFPCYGLAETTLIVSGGSPEALPVSRRFDTRELGRDRAAEAADGEAGRELVGCGRPLGDLEVAIVHPETLTRLPAHEIGEVWVAGGSVAQGYWNRPEATAETFGARTADGSGPYLRTGDLGFLAGDGELFITGRSKDLLILRGGNHYPQDVERTVEGSHPALVPGAAAAFAIEAGGEERLVVVQEVQRTERRADIREIAAAVRAAVAAEHELPLYALVLIRPGTIPKTTSGKIQRSRCREELLAGGLAVVSEWWETPLPAAEASAPSDVERWILSLLATTTGVAAEEIDPRLPVAHYGLDSLRAIELLHAIETGTGAAPSLESLWGGLTVAELAAEAAAALGAKDAEETAPPAVIAEDGDHPLTPGQSALWFLDRLEPGNAAYNIASAAEITGGVDVPALRAAFQGLIDRHPALRTTFPAIGGAPVARVHPAAEVDFAEVEAGPAGDEELRSRLALEAERPFDLERGPLFSVRLLGRGGGERPPVLLLVVHHIVADLWSLAVLVRDLGALYRAALAGDDAPLPDLPLTYAAHARRERANLAGPVGERLFAFWREALAGELPPLDLATDRPRPPVQTYRGAAEKVALPPALAPAVRELGRAAGASPFMTLAAAFAALLHRYTGMGTIALGTPTAGRRRADLAGLVGYFVNPVVLRADLSGDPGFGELLRRVRAVALTASEHQDLPFPTLVERLDPERDPSRSPLFQAMFAYQGVPAAADPALAAFALGEEGVEIEVGGLRLRHLPLPQRMAQFELTLSMGEVGGAFAGTLDYNTDLFDRATAVRLARNLTVLLTAATVDPARPIGDLPLLTEGERDEVVHTRNASRAVRGETPVHRLFAERAAETPGAAAVIFRGERLSYGDLDRRAGQLAGRLLALGIGPERVVGLCAERSPDLIAGILAILRTGAGYLPLDPETPPERRAFMLRDAGAAALITDQTSNLPADLPVLGIRADGGDRAEILPNPSNLACVLYTSGSTGEPKGVLLEHRHLTALVESFAASYAPGPGDAILPLTSVASASFVGEVLPLLATGGTVVLPDKEEMLAAPAILELAARQGVTILSTVPSLLALLNAAAGELPRLRLLLSGGEALAPGDVDRLLGRATIVNGYGLTETTVCSTVHVLGPEDLGGGRLLPIGRPLANHRVYVLDGNLAPRPIGCAGEVFIAGEGVARGFTGRPAETALRFLPDPFTAGERMLRTGDLARWRSDGSSLEYLGRIDQQVKIRGHRIELGEIEAALGRHPALREGAVALRELAGEMRLVAWVVPRQGETVRASDLLAFLRERLPAPMVPAAVAAVPALPLSANGKVDTAALQTPERPGASASEGAAAPRSEIERAIAAVWQEALGVPRVGVHDNFFDLGGHSLLMAKVHARLLEALPGGMGRELSLIDLFKHPTVATLARSLADEPETVAPAPRPVAPLPPGERVEIAVIGMSGRFPGARNPEELWQNLVQGIESITRFTDEELLAAGVPRSLVDNPNYVKAKGILGGVDLFDAAFFGLSPRGAELTDPQHRVFLECAWEALEAAGYDAGRYPGRIGVFAGQSMNTYWLNNLYHHIDLVASLDSLQAAIGNDKDSLTTEVSYRLDLRGPSVLVQSSSSTSLTAVHYACQSLKSGECDMALAGGVSIHLPEVSGYLYHEGGTTDPEGHCRTFDAEAKGFVSGHGAGVVVLKRLADALADGDDVLAVLKGSACNNDGSHKVSYMAPSVDGHAEVVRRAQEAAGVTPDTVTYVEAHGTGTLLGDPIEVAALTQAFRAGTDRKGFCALGSLKTNIGHLDTAAGIAGLIKTVLCLRHRTLPPILHFRSPNPKIDFAGSPFFVNDRLRPWETPDGVPRRAGVSSLGMGGTNTHVVLEEAPPRTAAPASERPLSLLVVSARTETALETLTDAMAEHLRSLPDEALPDAAWTLQAGRKLFPFRRAVVAATPHEAAGLLAARDPERVHSVAEEARERPVAFLLSGQGAQYPGMGRALYETEPVFRQEIDRAAELLRPHLGFDLREALYPALSPEDDAEETAAERLRQTAVAQPALFAVEHALARLLMSWGIRPDALLGHSVGEITAACLAGVFSLEDALGFVAVRGRLMQAMPPGSMLAVPLPEAEAAALADAHGVALAAINRPDLTVLSGPAEAIAAAAAELADRGSEGRPLVTSHAFHSSMMDPVMPELRAAAARCALQPPRLPFLSNLTGTWIRAEEATDPEYWARQMRGTVRFAAGLGELLAEPGRVLVEVGPGNALATAARQHPGRGATQPVLTTLRHARERRDDLTLLLESLGRLWAAGAVIDWGRFHAGAPRRRTALPTHPFERRRFWIEPKKVGEGEAKRGPASDPADWFHLPVWKRAGRLLPDGLDATGAARESWLLLADRGGLGTRLADRLLAAGAAVAVAPAGEDPAALLARLAGEGTSPTRIVHLGSLDAVTAEEAVEFGFLSLLALARAASARGLKARIIAVSSGVQEVTGAEELHPARATLLGAVHVIPREMPDLGCRSVDLPDSSDAWAGRLLAEIASAADDPVVALRGAHRWTRGFEPVRLEKGEGTERLVDGGVYLVTGGLGGIGGAVALHLARTRRAKLVLTSRSGLPSQGLVHELEALGAEVLVGAADVSDRAAMESILHAARERFGPIDGVFHAAGVPGGGLIERRTRAESLAVLAPKVLGTLVLSDLLAAEPPGFLVLFSSVTSLLSQPGQADYAAANAFLDSFAGAAATRGGPFTLAVNWDAWREVGMAVKTAVPEALRAWREESLRQGLLPAEGIEALERALASPHSQIVVSRKDFAEEVRESFASRPLDELERIAAPEPAAHARPALGSAYVAPRGEVEERIAALWQEILGIDRVGAHDNFFELGGNSLVGLKVISRLKAELGAEISAVHLFEGPTVAALARLLAPQDPAEQESLQEIYNERRSRGALRREKLRRLKG